MTDQGTGRDPDRELEERLRGHYQAIGSSSGPLLTARVADTLDRRPVRRWRFAVSTGHRAFAGALAGAAALAVIALAIGPLLLGSNSPSPAGPNASADATAALQRPPADPSAILAGAETSGLGSAPNGGVWWVQGDTSWFASKPTSASGHSPSVVSNTVPPAVVVLDEQHQWTVTLGPGSVHPWASQSPESNHLKAMVNRTADGGTTWQQASVPGDYPDSLLTLSFTDERQGFLMCSAPDQIGGSSTLLSTSDGGATWTVVATPALPAGSGHLGGMFTASDRSTLWAGSEGGHTGPILSVSRDSGLSWSTVRLPGLEGLAGGTDRWMEEAPVFLDANIGFVHVFSSQGGEFSDVFTTTDAGLTWTRQHLPFDARQVDYLDTNHWLVPGHGSIAVTADGGATWKTVGARGMGGGDFVKLVFFDTDNGLGLYEPYDAPGHHYLYRTSDGGQDWLLSSTMP